MNILFVHEVDWLNKVVFEIHNLAESLSVLNHKIYAIDYENNWKKKGIFNLGSLKTREVNNVCRAVPGASVSLRRPGFIRIPGLSRLSASITHCREIGKTIREKNIDAVMLYSVPTNGMQTLSLARKFNVPVVFRSIDILHRLVTSPILRPATRVLEKRVYSGADMILAITPNHARYVIGMGAEESRVKVLRLPLDTAIFHPSKDYSDVSGKWGLGEQDKTVVFIGTLFEFSGLDEFIRQFPGVLKSVPEAKLLVVGDGPQRSKLERIIAELGLEKNVIITGFQPYQTMPRYINMATVCVNPFINTDATRDIFPGKIIQYLACGKATVATPLLGIKSLIADESGGIVYADNAKDMAQKVVGLLKSTDYRWRLGQAGLDYVKRAHDQRIIACQLESELKEIIESKHRAKSV